MWSFYICIHFVIRALHKLHLEHSHCHGKQVKKSLLVVLEYTEHRPQVREQSRPRGPATFVTNSFLWSLGMECRHHRKPVQSLTWALGQSQPRVLSRTPHPPRRVTESQSLYSWCQRASPQPQAPVALLSTVSTAGKHWSKSQFLPSLAVGSDFKQALLFPSIKWGCAK